jgi:hypothetical protein
LRITYAERQEIDSSHYDLVYVNGIYKIKWAYDSWTISHDREKVYVDYDVSDRGDDTIACVIGGSHHVNDRLVQDYYDLTQSPSLVATYSTLVFSDPANEIVETFMVYYPLVSKTGGSLYAEAETIHDLTQALLVNSRKDPLSPMLHNYNLAPHVAYGGEDIAANPIEYLQDVSEKFFRANCSNAIISGGSLAYLRDRDLDFWYWWGGGLRDNGVDVLSATRAILRRGYTETRVQQDMNQHRYILEITCFAYEHNKRYPDQASVDYKGTSTYRRVWYYQADSGLYTAVQHVWDDMSSSYYDPIVIDGENYYFQYHYILVIPAFWSLVKPASYWSLNYPTIYDLLSDRLDYVTSKYDCDGAIISELLYYGHSFDTNDFTLYNWWRVNVKGWGTAGDWPRDSGTGYVNVDDTEIWEFKAYFMKEFLTNMATIVHGNGKLLGINAEVQNVIPVKFPNASVWNPYDKVEGQYGTNVDTLDYNCDRYGTPYDDLLKEDICDFFYVWLYYRYSGISTRVVDDFIAQYEDYKERMFITIGLFPKEDPPAEDEITELVQMLLKKGFNVTYAGYPPMLIQDSRWDGIWDNLFDYVPTVHYNTDSQIEIRPKKMERIPFLVR